jgi:hypothetical protein
LLAVIVLRQRKAANKLRTLKVQRKAAMYQAPNTVQTQFPALPGVTLPVQTQAEAKLHHRAAMPEAPVLLRALAKARPTLAKPMKTPVLPTLSTVPMAVE